MRGRAMARTSITMNASPLVIEIHGDDVTVEATYLAARLGLSVDRLQTEMRRGSSTAWLSAVWARMRGGYA
jgi:hypothetical protein